MGYDRGGVKAGETPEKAACREVKEELGIIINPENLKLDLNIS